MNPSPLDGNAGSGDVQPWRRRTGTACRPSASRRASSGPLPVRPRRASGGRRCARSGADGCRDAGLRRAAVEDVSGAVGGHRAPLAQQQKRRAGVWGAGRAPADGGRGPGRSWRAVRHHPRPGALAGDVGELPVQVDVCQLQPAQLRHPHAGVHQQPQQDLVAAARKAVRSKAPGGPRRTAHVLRRAAISWSVSIGTGLSGGLGIPMPSVSATSRSPSATSHRQNQRIPRNRVPTVEVSASQAATACRVSSSSTGSRLGRSAS